MGATASGRGPEAFTSAANELVRRGYLLRDDADAMIAEPEAMPVGR